MSSGALRDRLGPLFGHRRFRLLAALLAAALLFAAAYRIARVGVAENFSRTDPELALQLSPGLPVAMRARVEQLRVASSRDSVAIEKLLRDSLSTDPVDGRSLGLLGLEASLQGRADADRLLDAGIRRAPRDMELRQAAISRSLRDNRIEDAVTHIIAILRVRTDRADEPGRAHQYLGWLWHVYAGSPDGREAVKKLALAPSPWRAAFLAHVASNSAPADALHLIGELERRQFAATTSEYDAVVRALLARREWRAAFALWMQDPARAQERRIPNLYNGDFSRTPDGRPGFDWEFMQHDRARIAVEEVSGNQRHLRVDSPGQAASGALASHLLILGPGTHDLRARVRSENLGRDDVPMLRLSCLHSAGSTPIVALKLNDSNSTWREFSTSAQIPRENCAAQQLDLGMEITTGARTGASGTLWVDDVSVARVPAKRDLQPPLSNDENRPVETM